MAFGGCVLRVTAWHENRAIQGQTQDMKESLEVSCICISCANRRTWSKLPECATSWTSWNAQKTTSIDAIRVREDREGVSGL